MNSYNAEMERRDWESFDNRRLLKKKEFIIVLQNSEDFNEALARIKGTSRKRTEISCTSITPEGVVGMKIVQEEEVSDETYGELMVEVEKKLLHHGVNGVESILNSFPLASIIEAIRITEEGIKNGNISNPAGYIMRKIYSTHPRG